MDYLDGILNRALNATPVAERRRPSMFEPKPPEILQPQGPIELNEERVAPTPPRAAPTLRQPAEPPATIQPAPNLQRPKETAQIPSVDPVTPSRQRLEIESHELAEERTARRQQPSPTPEARTVPFPPSAEAPGFEDPVRTEETVLANRVEHVEHFRQIEQKAREVIETNSVQREVLIAPRIERSPLPVEDPSRREQSEKPSEVAKAARPAIEISIGRIEVRASMSPPAPSRPLQRSKEPQVGLEAYLKSRSGGKK